MASDAVSEAEKFFGPSLHPDHKSYVKAQFHGETLLQEIQRLRADNAILATALQDLVDIVDPPAKGKRPQIEAFFVEPVAKAREALKSALRSLGKAGEGK